MVVDKWITSSWIPVILSIALCVSFWVWSRSLLRASILVFTVLSRRSSNASFCSKLVRFLLVVSVREEMAEMSCWLFFGWDESEGFVVCCLFSKLGVVPVEAVKSSVISVALEAAFA